MAKVTGGDKLGVKLGDLGKKIASGKKVRVGFLEGATYPDGKSVPMIAAINEYGAPSRGQPPRPFFRNTIAAHQSEWPRVIADLLKTNDMDAAKTLAQVGAVIAGQIRQGIVDLMAPPLAASTVRKKGSSKPLVDTGHMLASVDFEVKT